MLMRSFPHSLLQKLQVLLRSKKGIKSRVYPVSYMKIKTKISFREYTRLLYAVTYRRPIMMVIVAVALLIVIWITGYYTNTLPVPKPVIYQYITLLLIIVVQPIAIYATIWKNYHSSSHLKEPLQMEFTKQEIKMWGESFYTELIWCKMYKVEELNNWFLIYQNSLAAVIIPKKVFDKNEEADFKKFLQKISCIPVHLK